MTPPLTTDEIARLSFFIAKTTKTMDKMVLLGADRPPPPLANQHVQEEKEQHDAIASMHKHYLHLQSLVTIAKKDLEPHSSIPLTEVNESQQSAFESGDENHPVSETRTTEHTLKRKSDETPDTPNKKAASKKTSSQKGAGLTAAKEMTREIMSTHFMGMGIGAPSPGEIEPVLMKAVTSILSPRALAQVRSLIAPIMAMKQSNFLPAMKAGLTLKEQFTRCASGIRSSAAMQNVNFYYSMWPTLLLHFHLKSMFPTLKRYPGQYMAKLSQSCGIDAGKMRHIMAISSVVYTLFGGHSGVFAMIPFRFDRLLDVSPHALAAVPLPLAERIGKVLGSHPLVKRMCSVGSQLNKYTFEDAPLSPGLQALSRDQRPFNAVTLPADEMMELAAPFATPTCM